MEGYTDRYLRVHACAQEGALKNVLLGEYKMVYYTQNRGADF